MGGLNYYGRKVLYTNASEITRGNLLTVLNKLCPVFENNRKDIDYLYWYFCGKQPVLEREKKVRPEICNNVVENHANEIVSFKKGYAFGEPVQYVRRAVNDTDGGTTDGQRAKDILTLNEIMSCEDKAAKNIELAEWFYISGTGYLMALPKKEDDGTVSPIEIEVLDPRDTAVVYYTGFGKKPVMSIQRVVLDNPMPTGEDTVRLCIYTPSKYFEVEAGQIVKEEKHALGFIPVFEYPANKSRLGAFEIVLDILDAINLADSNRLDGVEQFVQSFMKFINVNIDDAKYDAFREKGVLMFNSDPGNPAEVSIISSELNQTQVQILVDHLYQMALIICGMPDRQGTGKTTGDTGQAVMLRDGWSAAETNAKDTENIFKRSEKQFLRYILHLLSDKLKINVGDIDIKFTRNKTDNLLVKTQGLQNMLEAGVSPSIAFSLSNLFGDPEQACVDSREYLEKWKAAEATTTPGNNKETPKE